MLSSCRPSGFRLGCAAVVSAALLGCAGVPVHGDAAFAPLHLFDRETPRFSVAYSCAGQVSTETDLCWVPAKYFRLWADARRIAIRERRDDATEVNTAAGPHVSGIDYRVVVRFAPVVSESYTSEADGLGGYKPPRAGYRADVYIYTAADGALVAHTDYHRKTDAAFRGDAVPFVKAGVHDVISALDPAYAPPADEAAARPRCADRPGRSLQGCGEKRDGGN